MIIEYVKDKLKNSFLKDKNWILSITLTLLTLFISNYIYKTQAKRVESLNAKKETELKKNGLLDQISQAEQKIQSYKDLLKSKDIPSVINIVNKIATDSNLKIISIKPNREEKYPAYIKYPFVLNLGADSYHAVGKFISKIENYPDLYFFDAINIKLQEIKQLPAEASGQIPKTSHKLNVNLTLGIIAFEG